MSNWISVKDKMPKEEPHLEGLASDLVIVYATYEVNGDKFVSDDITFNGKWVNFPEDKYTVTHWMKMPEPPKEPKEEEYE